jgi:hypothetical protein
VFVSEGPHCPDLEQIARAGPDRVRVLPPQWEDCLRAPFSLSATLRSWSRGARHGGSVLLPSKTANVLAAACPAWR